MAVPLPPIAPRNSFGCSTDFGARTWLDGRQACKLETDYERFEVVRISTGFRLIDPESYQRRYLRSDGIPLEPGIYVVHWPATVSQRRFDHHAIYLGPFTNLERASAAVADLRNQMDAKTHAPAGTPPNLEMESEQRAR